MSNKNFQEWYFICV